MTKLNFKLICDAKTVAVSFHLKRFRRVWTAFMAHHKHHQTIIKWMKNRKKGFSSSARKTFQCDKKRKMCRAFPISFLYAEFCIVQKVKFYLKLTAGLEQWFPPIFPNENRYRKIQYKSCYSRWKSNEHSNGTLNTDGNRIFASSKLRWRV